MKRLWSTDELSLRWALLPDDMRLTVGHGEQAKLGLMCQLAFWGYFQQRNETRHRRSAVEEHSSGFLERSIGMQVVVEGAARDVAELSADGRNAA
jgi:hypothetical protein